jgi:ketosteroid isomerase-like protein
MLRDDVLTAVRGRAEALVSGDPERLRGWLHEQFVWTSHRGEVFDRAGYIAANTHRLSCLSQEIEDPQVTTVGDTAVVVGAVRDVVEREGKPVVFFMRITQTWVLDAGQLRCLAGHAGPLTPQDHT